MTKKELREECLNERNSLSPIIHKFKSENICTHIVNFVIQKDVNSLGLYYPFKKEPNILAILEALPNKCDTFFPFIEKNYMEFKQVKSLSELVIGKFSIPAPAETAKTETPELLLIPSVAVSKSFHRLGMGGGFYDKYLTEHKSIIKCAVIFNDFDNIDFPHDIWDIKMGFVISELGIKEL